MRGSQQGGSPLELSAPVELLEVPGALVLDGAVVELVAPPPLVVPGSVVGPSDPTVLAALVSSPLEVESDVPFVDPSTALPLHAHANNNTMTPRRDTSGG